MTTYCVPVRAPRPAVHPHPTIRRTLSHSQLKRVIHEVQAVDAEQGLAACFAVADLLELSADSHIRNVGLPPWQWLRIADAVIERAEGLFPGGSPDVLRDWAELGPRVA